MLRYAQQRIEQARVPINLTQAPVEALPFPDATFDSVIATLVFCSVTDPAKGLREIMRVLKPNGILFMAEHVRSHKAIAAIMQDIATPLLGWSPATVTGTVILPMLLPRQVFRSHTNAT